jgi:hypothetical protein
MDKKEVLTILEKTFEKIGSNGGIFRITYTQDILGMVGKLDAIYLDIYEMIDPERAKIHSFEINVVSGQIQIKEQKQKGKR